MPFTLEIEPPPDDVRDARGGAGRGSRPARGSWTKPVALLDAAGRSARPAGSRARARSRHPAARARERRPRTRGRRGALRADMRSVAAPPRRGRRRASGRRGVRPRRGRARGPAGTRHGSPRRTRRFAMASRPPGRSGWLEWAAERSRLMNRSRQLALLVLAAVVASGPGRRAGGEASGEGGGEETARVLHRAEERRDGHESRCT